MLREEFARLNAQMATSEDTMPNTMDSRGGITSFVHERDLSLPHVDALMTPVFTDSALRIARFSRDPGQVAHCCTLHVIATEARENG
jgi:hypothetical protein